VKNGAQPDATSASAYSYAIPPMISSDASQSSGMSCSADGSTSTGAMSAQNPFETLILPPVPAVMSGVPPSSPMNLAQSTSAPFADKSTVPVILGSPPPTPPRTQPIAGISTPTSASPSTPHLQVQGSSPMLVPPVPTLAHQPHNGIASHAPQRQVPHNNVVLFDDDENTANSSAANTLEVPNTSGISRFLESTKRRMTANSRRDSDDNENGSGSIISGYLQKLGRNGKWQVRWFESDGESLSYYKSDKRSKLLATLDLQKVRLNCTLHVNAPTTRFSRPSWSRQVGHIEIDPSDKTELSFRIQVLGRHYHLRADSRASCSDWVITLNRVKEASLQQGNVKLVGGSLSLSHLNPLDLMTNSATSQQSGTPRVVVVSNRQRTRAVDQDDAPFDQLIRVDDTPDPNDPAYNPHSRRSTLSTVVVARWTKHQTSLQKLGTKLGVWARSLKKYSCVDGASGQVQPNAVYLDRHVHPPSSNRTRPKC
jgi:PH domain